MKNILWIIEDFMGDDHTLHLYDAVLNSDIDVLYKKYYDFTYDELSIVDTDRPIIVFGSIQFLNTLKEWSFKFIPGIIGYDYSKYSMNTIVHNYQKYALNYGGTMYTLHEFLNNLDTYWSECIFICPNMPDKVFNGNCVTVQNFEQFKHEELDVYEVPLNTEIYVAPKQIIYHEWRCIICNKQIVTITKYKQYNTSVRYEEYNNIELEQFIHNMIQQYYPDDIFVLDVCQTEDGYFVLELGMFSCSGLYTKDAEKLVDVINKYYQK